MKSAEFKLRYPTLRAASMTMFFDSGGMSFLETEHWIAIETQSLPYLTEDQLAQAERELAALSNDDRETILCGEHYEMLRMNQSSVLYYVLGVLFDGRMLDMDKSSGVPGDSSTYVYHTYETWLPGFLEDVEKAKTAPRDED